jgi:pimeloyl-ACP methyl ester carboxylesterase
VRDRAGARRHAAEADGGAHARHPARYYHPAAARTQRPAHRRRPHRPRAGRARPPRRRTAQDPPGPLGYAYQVYATAGWSSLLWLHRDPQPALVIAGEDDPSVPLRNGRVLAARLPNARQPGVKWGGHLFLLDEPESVAGVIGDFLDAPWRGRARGAQR